MEIKSFCPSMQQDVSELFRQYFTFLHENFEPSGHHRDVMDIQRWYLNNGHFWCLFEEDRLVGAIGVKWLGLDERALEIKRFYVDEKYRGNGYGNRLMETVISK